MQPVKADMIATVKVMICTSAIGASMSIFADMATMHSVKSKVAGDFILVNATITRSLDW